MRIYSYVIGADKRFFVSLGYVVGRYTSFIFPRTAFGIINARGKTFFSFYFGRTGSLVLEIMHRYTLVWNVVSALNKENSFNSLLLGDEKKRSYFFSSSSSSSSSNKKAHAYK